MHEKRIADARESLESVYDELGGDVVSRAAVQALAFAVGDILAIVESLALQQQRTAVTEAPTPDPLEWWDDRHGCPPWSELAHILAGGREWSRLRNELWRAGFRNSAQLAATPDAALREVSGIGPKGLRLLRERIPAQRVDSPRTPVLQ